MIDNGETIEAQDIIKGVAWYADDGGASDAYAITLPVSPGSYTDGLKIAFRANTANAGPCTLNINTIGAIAIKRPDTSDTISGDIVAGQIVEVVYRSGSFFMTSPVAGEHYAFGVASYTPSGGTTVQNIAHGLGVVPKRIRAVLLTELGSVQTQQSQGAYNGVSKSCIYYSWNSGGSGSWVPGTDTSNILIGSTSSSSSSAVPTFDATNIVLTWSNSNGGIAGKILWEAWA